MLVATGSASATTSAPSMWLRSRMCSPPIIPLPMIPYRMVSPTPSNVLRPYPSGSPSDGARTVPQAGTARALIVGRPAGTPLGWLVHPLLVVRMGDLDDWATAHHGVVSMEVSGLTRSSWYRAVRSGQLDQLHPGVARLHGTPDTAEQRIMAAVLAVGRPALASHRSAAHLWGSAPASAN